MHEKRNASLSSYDHVSLVLYDSGRGRLNGKREVRKKKTRGK